MGYFGLKGGWLTFWVTVACATDMTLFGYALKPPSLLLAATPHPKHRPIIPKSKANIPPPKKATTKASSAA